MPRPRLTVAYVAALLAALLLAGCVSAPSDPDAQASGSAGEPTASPSAEDDTEPLTLAFAGDVHFQGSLAELPRRAEATLGRLSRHLRSADLAMVNLESALARGGQRTDKELEDPSQRYWFRAPPAALRVLDRSGVDVVSMGNNHAADYGAAGLRQTLAAAEDSPVAVVGVGADAEEAFAPHRATVNGTDVAVLAADTMPRESADPIWAAGEGGPGVASARGNRPRRLLAAVRDAAAEADLVVVYLHWGRAQQQCPTDQQRRLARQLSGAGADVVVGSAAHVLLGAGMLEDTYVAYGLADFAWYHGARGRTGVLRLRVADGQVVADQFVPGRIPEGGGVPQGLAADAREQAREEWRRLRGCANLRPVGQAGDQQSGGDSARPELPAYEARVREIGSDLRARMIASSHRPQRCPVDLADLRHLRLSYVGFDGEQHTGELVVHADHADDVVRVFEQLYDARFPIRRMQLVDEYGGDDNASMADNNTSAYNCRRVAGQDTWSAHAYGAAIDINPVQNPYVTDDGVLPPQGRRYVDVDRSADADSEPGVIRRGDVVMRAFEEIGWSWGGDWSQPDYQHFTAR